MHERAKQGMGFVAGVGLTALVLTGQPPKVVPIPQGDGGEFAGAEFAADDFVPAFLALCGGPTTCDDPAVTVYFDGRVALSRRLTIEEGARAFWASVAAQFPRVKPAICGEAPR